ncbi:hypothetical protein INR49_011337 [Caranx melampygus]|nr:hypothetical protein INR49_011337 [Caranx melampygus]
MSLLSACQVAVEYGGMELGAEGVWGNEIQSEREGERKTKWRVYCAASQRLLAPVGEPIGLHLEHCLQGNSVSIKGDETQTRNISESFRAEIPDETVLIGVSLSPVCSEYTPLPQKCNYSISQPLRCLALHTPRCLSELTGPVNAVLCNNHSLST